MPGSVVETSVKNGWGQVKRDLAASDGPRFIHLDHSSAGAPGVGLMKVARDDPDTREILNHLTNLGFYIYLLRGGTTRLVHHDEVRTLWRAVADGTFQMTHDGVVHSYAEPIAGSPERLVVVFSPMAADPFETSINRYFVQTYPTLQKHLAPGTAVLRVADVGGVKGAFYSDTTYLPNNFETIHNFISGFVEQNGFARERVVFYGPSKGGTGAALHGLHGGWNFVAADPIVSDELYEKKWDDLHFTTGDIFPRKKHELFAEVVEARANADLPPWLSQIVICSSRSSQYPFISGLFEDLHDSVTMLDSQHPEINDHPDVASATLYLQATALNNVLAGFGLPAGSYIVP